VSEGSASNVFIVKHGKLLTPPKGPTLLPGITRDLILELAQQNGVACAEQLVTEEDLLSADEIMICSTLKEILAVTHLNGIALNGGVPGPKWRKLYDLFQDYKKSLRQTIDK
jgi:D-alanine transaminase